MSQSKVPDGVLRWLYNSLKPEYHDVERVYSDVAEVLSRYPSLAPRTEVHIFENGASALLVLLQGTVPVPFRGATYRYPLSIWIPYTYPRDAPMVYVNPTRDMVVRPGQHVSVEGRVYHPYLADWASRPQDSNIITLLSIVAEVFSKDPPVTARQKIPETGPPRPSHPGQLNGPTYDRRYSSPVASPSLTGSSAPLPPPKPSLSRDTGFDPQRSNSIGSRPGSSAPPLPPKPGGSGDRSGTNGPPLPPLPNEQQSRGSQSYYDQRPGSRLERRPPAIHSYTQQAPIPTHYLAQPSQPSPMRPSFHQQYSTPNSQQRQQYPPQQQARSQQQLPQHFQHPLQHQEQQYQQHPHLQQLPPQPLRRPVPDLLSPPLDSTSPTSSHTQSHPTIPPPRPQNPEKDLLLSQISTALHTLLTQSLSQNTSAIPALQSQQRTIAQFHSSLTAELSALQSLDATLSTNEQILREAIREAEAMEKSLAGREVPGIDDVLAAPTVVGEQLYGLVAEERGLAEAMFVLQRALERDRVGGEVFVKQTRSLAREQFLKKALIRKIAVGMGLSVGGVA